jgi:hypothetical protein
MESLLLLRRQASQETSLELEEVLGLEVEFQERQANDGEIRLSSCDLILLYLHLHEAFQYRLE